MTDTAQDCRDGDRFDWADLDPDDIVAPPQNEVAAYVNRDGDLVIRARADLFDQDAVIVIGRPYVAALIKQIAAVFGIVAPPISPDAAPPEPVALLPAPGHRDRTAADRQRRFRKRHNQARNGVAAGAGQLTNTKEKSAG